MPAPTGSGHKSISSLGYLHSRMAIVRVGQQKKEYGVHQALICDKSNFFKKALTGSFAEARTGIVPLEDVSAPLFTIFVSWLYVGRLIYVAPPDSGKTIQDDFSSLVSKENDEQQEHRSTEDEGIFTLQPGNAHDDAFGRGTPQHGNDRGEGQGVHEVPKEIDPAVANCTEEDPKTWPLDVLAKLYILGDFLDAQLFQNQVMDVIVDFAAISRNRGVWRVPKRLLIRHIYENSPTGSFLRNIIVDFVVYHQPWDEPSQLWEEMPAEFLAKVMVSMGRRVPSKLCKECYSDAIAGNRLTHANADGMCLKRDKAPFMLDACFYHVHGTAEEREKCQTELKEKRRELRTGKS
ncbi:hypothetical protein D6C85_01910 [Aureobasidium pullulans]|uniref:BTB domain-containing protein n=1 Tax=Aureobasidium pullulans TaxID=5580 RepID=A0A4S9XDI7_AURPU|nr:hypothetical protein D6C85_01910 [Aureobasidium pullulans]